MPSSYTFTFGTKKGPGAKAAIRQYFRSFIPTQGDLLMLLQIQRSNILKRTSQGIDKDGKAFHPYSNKGPYYWYPSKSKDRANRKRTARQLARKLVGILDAKEQRKRQNGKRAIPFGGITPGGAIKFRNYGEFKTSLGRTVVDLRGPSAPHMLQALLVRAGSTIIKPNRQRNIEAKNMKFPTSVGRIQIFGSEGDRAAAHMRGRTKKRLPRRNFLGANNKELKILMNILIDRMQVRADIATKRDFKRRTRAVQKQLRRLTGGLR